MPKKKLSTKKKLIFVGITFLLLLFVAEIGIRVYCWIDGRYMPAISSTEDEWEWAEEHLKEQKSEWENAHYRFDPHTGWQNKPNLKIEEDGIRINSQGMRNDEEFTLKKIPGRKRILFVGDSYTRGSHVTNDETYVYVLKREHMPDWEIMNLAVGGFGADQTLLTFEKYGKQFEPDIVVFGYFVLDYLRNLKSFFSYRKPYFVVNNGKVELQGHPVIPPQELYNDYLTGKKKFPQWYDSYLINGLAKVIQKVENRTFEESSTGWKISSYILERFQKGAQEIGAKPILLVIPTRDTITEENSRYKNIEILCEKKSKELKMLCLRIDSKLQEFSKENPDKKVYRPKEVGGHFSTYGHEVTAQAIFEFLMAHNFIEK